MENPSNTAEGIRVESRAAREQLRLYRLNMSASEYSHDPEYQEVCELIDGLRNQLSAAMHRRAALVQKISHEKLSEVSKAFNGAERPTGVCFQMVAQEFGEPTVLLATTFAGAGALEGLGNDVCSVTQFPASMTPNEEIDELFKHARSCECKTCAQRKMWEARAEAAQREAEAEFVARTAKPVEEERVIANVK